MVNQRWFFFLDLKVNIYLKWKFPNFIKLTFHKCTGKLYFYWLTSWYTSHTFSFPWLFWLHSLKAGSLFHHYFFKKLKLRSQNVIEVFLVLFSLWRYLLHMEFKQSPLVGFTSITWGRCIRSSTGVVISVDINNQHFYQMPKSSFWEQDTLLGTRL